MEATNRMAQPRHSRYEAPSLTVLGTLHGRTEADKKLGESDGYTFLGQAISNNS